MPGGEKSLQLPHEAWKVILPLSGIITNFSPLGSILTAKTNKQVNTAHPKINDQLCVHEEETFWLLPSLLLEENWSPQLL